MPSMLASDAPGSTDAAPFGGSGLAALRQLLADVMHQAEGVCRGLHSGAHCAECGDARRLECDTHTVERLGEVVFLAFERFTTEDRFMRRLQQAGVCRNRAMLDAHKADHAEILERLAALVHEWQSDNPKLGIQHLAQRIRAWMREHIDTHDVLLQQLLALEEPLSPLQGAKTG